MTFFRANTVHSQMDKSKTNIVNTHDASKFPTELILVSVLTCPADQFSVIYNHSSIVLMYASVVVSNHCNQWSVLRHEVELTTWSEVGYSARTMTSVPLQLPHSFNFQNPDDWSQWKRRFEQYCLASGLSEESEVREVSTLLYCLGEEAKDVLRRTGKGQGLSCIS